jgi:hypothetical protein
MQVRVYKRTGAVLPLLPVLPSLYRFYFEGCFISSPDAIPENDFFRVSNDLNRFDKINRRVKDNREI